MHWTSLYPVGTGRLGWYGSFIVTPRTREYHTYTKLSIQFVGTRTEIPDLGMVVSSAIQNLHDSCERGLLPKGAFFDSYDGPAFTSEFVRDAPISSLICFYFFAPEGLVGAW